MEFINELKYGFLELQKNFQDWKTNFNDFYKSFQEFKAGFTKIYNAIDSFFTVFPIEVLILLFFTVFILILLNSISPNTTRINATIAVGFICVVWMYFNQVFTGTYKIVTVFKASLYILTPLYAFSIFKIGLDIGKRLYYKSKYTTSEHAKILVQQIHEAHYSFLKSSFELEKNPKQVLDSIQILKTSIEDLEKSILKKI